MSSNVDQQQVPYQVEPFDPEEDDPDEWLQEHRDMLEFEANSDAPDAWVFQQFLDHIESTGEST